MDDKIAEGRKILHKLIGEKDFNVRDAAANSFNREFQAFCEDVAFASVWARPGLDWKTRSISCISALTALGLWSPLRLHIHSALNNGASVEELKELVIHLAVYCGLPAAAETGKIIEGVLAERGLLS